MKKNEKKTAMQVRTAAICGCLCLAALGAGVTYRAFDQSHLEKEGPQAAEIPVTAVKSPSVEVAQLERDRQSNDPGEEPEKEGPVRKESEKMTFWYPLEGKVVLPYSTEHAIYDPTLEQYRTNASISISAGTGTEVRAAADGRVQAVREDAEAGTVITISHKDGWLTTYGQLQDAVTVKEGETVARGQKIGTVNDPTKYGVALGSHLEFSMEQNGEPKDPANHLEKK